MSKNLIGRDKAIHEKGNGETTVVEVSQEATTVICPDVHKYLLPGIKSCDYPIPIQPGQIHLMCRMCGLYVDIVRRDD